ncbi:hypothetical protein Tco_0238083 [Tanacetum coccineum]
MADHSQNWYNEATTWHGSSNNLKDITNIIKRIVCLECDMQKLQENIHAIEEGCKIRKVGEEVHLTKEHPLKDNGKVGEHFKYIGFLEETMNRFMEESIKKQSSLDERIRRFKDDMDMSFRMLDDATKNLQRKSKKLTQEILTSSMADKYDESTIQFPGHLKEQEDEAQAFRTLGSLKKLKINRSLICAVKKMLEYLMYVKDVFSSKKPIVEKDAVRLNDRCTTVLQSQPPQKENDPGRFTLPCLIGNFKIRSALTDLGVSINVMRFSMFQKLKIGNLQPTNMMVEMADMTKKDPKGIIENVLVQIDKFIFPVDFVIIDMVEDHNAPLILGRPFLATAHAHIDVFNRQISLGVGEERVSFEIDEPMDDPYINYESVCMIECSRETHEEEFELLLASDTQSAFTKMKGQSCIVDINEKSKPFIHQLNPLPGISQLSKSSIKMGKKRGEITSPPRYDTNLSFFYPEENLRTPDVSCCFPPHFISSEGIDTPVLGKLSLQGNGIQGLHDSFYVVDARGVVLGQNLTTGKHFKIGLIGYHAVDDDGSFLLWMLLMEADLEHGLEHVVSSLS